MPTLPAASTPVPRLTEPDLDSARARFRDTYGRVAERAWLAPGRVNLIGEHTDYNDGFVLPLAIPSGCLALAAGTNGSTLSFASAQESSAAAVDVADLSPGNLSGWSAYTAGVAGAMRGRGLAVRGADVLVDGNVPAGAGLSSSAALVCSVAGVLDDLFDLGCSGADLVALTRTAENDFAGAPTGGMDQLVSVRGRAGHALLCDMRSLEVEQVPFDLSAAGLALLVIDTRAPHGHVDGEYGARRQACEQAAGVLGVAALRDVAADGLDDALTRLRADGGDRADELVKRTRHVVTENARVLDTAALLRAGRIRDIGPLLTDSHASMRDDFQITVAQVDLVVRTALAHGGLGSRMTGGGFGGCVISLVEADQVDQIAAAVIAAFDQHGFDRPVPFTAVATDGLRPAGAAATVGDVHR